MLLNSLEFALFLPLTLDHLCIPKSRWRARNRERFVRLPPGVQGTLYATATIVAFFIAPATERFIFQC